MMKVSAFLVIAVIAYGLHGLGALLAPAQIFGLWGYALNDAGQLVARTLSAALIGFAVIFWLARKAENSGALRAILLGNAIYLFIEAVIIVLGVLSGIGNASAWGGVVVDLLLGAGFAYYYAQLARASAA